MTSGPPSPFRSGSAFKSVSLCCLIISSLPGRLTAQEHFRTQSATPL